ncbi:MAG: Glu/Leu/Phe/Val dehydrogenase [Solirubrobacterales bacterium]|nr:Glu/Leu/Phe/Val dehydrogenase [Solirubrobacterales bacterium]MBV9534708.1 Glu/Leu/Phe/Val dehydrogenase [Solirubrobacterales bacterium]
MTALAPGRPLFSDYHEIRVREGKRSGLTMAIAVHRTVDGRSLGGLRFEPYRTADDAILDVKRLARAMTFKAAVAGLRLGGGKGVIAAEPDSPPDAYHRRLALRDFAELVDSFGGQYITAQDAGTSEEDIGYMARFTDHVSGRPRAQGGSGDPSPYTAHGVEVAVRGSLRGQLEGRHVLVIGLGHVGSKLAVRLDAAGAELTVSDVDQHKRELADQLGARWLEPHQAMVAEADVLAPCALGGMLDHDSVANLHVSVVAGAANNQLASDSVADALRKRGVVWAPDFVVNAGGLIAVSDELHGFDSERVERSIERIGETLGEIYARAAAAGTNTLIAAQELAAERLGGLHDNDR